MNRLTPEQRDAVQEGIAQAVLDADKVHIIELPGDVQAIVGRLWELNLAINDFSPTGKISWRLDVGGKKLASGEVNIPASSHHLRREGKASD